MNRQEGRKIIVTGGGSGIGRAIVARFASEGADIGIFDRDTAGAEATAEIVRKAGREVFVEIGDVSVRDDVTAGVGALIRQLGQVDVLVPNAGIIRLAPVLETTEQDWRDLFSVNVDGVLFTIQAALPTMVERGAGCVVSMASWCGKKGLRHYGGYCASKFAVIGLTQSLAVEMAPHGIRVNAVCPGLIVETRMRDESEVLLREQGLPNADERARTTIPLERPGLPKDVANAVAFLASDDADYMTGQAINVTGGLWMH